MGPALFINLLVKLITVMHCLSSQCTMFVVIILMIIPNTIYRRHELFVCGGIVMCWIKYSAISFIHSALNNTMFRLNKSVVKSVSGRRFFSVVGWDRSVSERAKILQVCFINYNIFYLCPVVIQTSLAMVTGCLKSLTTVFLHNFYIV